MQYYPLFLDITSYKCLVLGAGQVARRKIDTLLKAKPLELLVIDPFLSKEDFLTSFEKEYGYSPSITYLQRNFELEDLENVRLAFACTKSSDVNGDFATICKEHAVLCNVIEGTSRGDFIVPSHLDYDNLVIALSTSGVSPAFTKALKEDIRFYLSKGYVPFLRLLRALRPLILEHVAEYKRAELFRSLVAKDFREEVMALLELKKIAELKRKLATLLPESVVSEINDIESFYKK